MLVARIDRYLLTLILGTFGSVVGVLMSLMVLEHIPRLLEVTRLSGHRGYIIGQTILGLLPEYAGIGVVVGFYLAVGMAIRKLALRGELAVIEATGIGPARWMRTPLILTVLGAAFVLVNQGWLMPYGERRLAEIGHRMEIGEFGVNLPAREFNDLGGGVTLYYDSVDDETGTLQGLFLTDAERTYNALSGKLSLALDGRGVVHLANGQAIDHDKQAVVRFSELTFHAPGARSPVEGDTSAAHRLRQETLDTLLASDDRAYRSAAHSRLLWGVLVLMSGALAFILARPPMRSASAIGLAVGLCLLVGFLKSIALLEGAAFPRPGLAGVAIALIWTASIGMLFVWHKQAGNGAIDAAVLALVRRIARQLRRRRSGEVDPISPAFDVGA